jgi:CheY-like chemotaxis protein
MDQFATIVLLIDPDARHRATAAQLLKSGGCSVVAVRNAAEAIETFDAHHADIALIIADDEVVHAAPGEVVHAARGHEALQLLPELRRIDAGVPVVVMTDAAELRHDRYRAIDLAGVLSKPLQAHDVSAVLPLISQGPAPAAATATAAPAATLAATLPPAVAVAMTVAPEWQFPVQAAPPTASSIGDIRVPRFARRRARVTRVTRSQRLIATAAATLVGLALTTWLEIRGGAAPQLPEPVPPPSVEIRAPQTHDIRQAISPVSLPTKAPPAVRRRGLNPGLAPARPPAHRKSRKARGGARPPRASVRRADTTAPRPARVKRLLAFVRRAPRLCAKPFAALWRKLQDPRAGGGDVEREARGAHDARDDRASI